MLPPGLLLNDLMLSVSTNVSHNKGDDSIGLCPGKMVLVSKWDFQDFCTVIPDILWLTSGTIILAQHKRCLSANSCIMVVTLAMQISEDMNMCHLLP